MKHTQSLYDRSGYIACKVFLSFSGLISMITEFGFAAHKDDATCIYAFGCSRDGIQITLERYEGKDEHLILEMLEKAERQGRVRWADEDNSSPLSEDVFVGLRWLIKKFDIQGVLTGDVPSSAYEWNRLWYIPCKEVWIEENTECTVVVNYKNYLSVMAMPDNHVVPDYVTT